MAKTINYS